MSTIKKAICLLSSISLLSMTATADLTVTGNFLYQDRPFTFGAGFSSIETELPIRLAKVQVINATNNAVLATGTTDEMGQVSIFIAGSGTTNLLVRCFSQSDAFGSKSLRVTNGSNNVYSVSSATVLGHNMGVDLDIGTVKALKLTTGSLQGNAFNMLDQMVWGIQYIKASNGSNPPQSLQMVWPGGSGSFAQGTTANISDDDGYDDIVQLHELGHVLHNVYSDSDSPGGSHSFTQSDQDPRLSFGEGWASFFAGAVRQHAGIFDPGFYMDLLGNGATGSASFQLRMRYENGFPFAASTGGEADEGAIHCALWDLIDRANTNDSSQGFDDDAFDGTPPVGVPSADIGQWQVFTGHIKSVPNLTIRDLWNGWFTTAGLLGQTELESVFSQWKIRFFEDIDEPNQTRQTATSIGTSGSFSSTKTMYFASSPLGAPGGGDSDFYSFALNLGSTFSVETRYPNNSNDAETYADVRIEVFRPDGTLLAQDNDSGAGRNAKLSNLIANVGGDWSVRVFSTHSFRKTGSYELRVNASGGTPAALQIGSITPTQVPAVLVDSFAQVTVSGTGFLGVNAVKVDGAPLPSFPPKFVVIDDNTLIFSMPKLAKLGLIAIEILTPTASAQTSLQIVVNSSPTLELRHSDPAALIQSSGLQITVGGNPGDIAFIAVSPDLLPSPLPGIVDVDLAIGNNSTSLIILAAPSIGAPGFTEITFPVSGLPAGTKLHVQSAHLLSSTFFALPAQASNTQSATVFF